MATYTVRTPDGKTLTLQGPDGASQADVIAQAQKLYQPSAAPQSNGASTATYLARYNSIRNALGAKIPDPDVRTRYLAKYDALPQTQRLRQLAGLAPVSTANGDVQQVAKQSLQQRIQAAGADAGKNANGFQAASAGISRGLFGIPEMLAAAGERFLPSSITGNKSDASYSQILQMIRAKDSQEIEDHPVAGTAGEVGGSIASVAPVAGAVRAIGARAAASAAPVVARAGNVLQSLATLRKGQTAANIGKLAVAGGAAGGAQAAGTGGDVVSGTEAGVVAAPVVAALGSAAGRFLIRPAADILGLSNAGSYLRRFTDAPLSEIKQALADRQASGVQPTLFEVLPQADRNRLMEHTIAGRDPVVESVLSHIQDRAANVGPEMADTVHAATNPQRLQIQRQMVNDLETARGSSSGTPVPGAPGEDAQTAYLASHSPTGMQDLYHKEASLIMAPHDATPVVDKFTDLLPQTPVTDVNGTVQAVETDPEVSSMIRTAGGRLASRKPGDPINVGEISNMISRLRNIAFKGGNDGALAENAASHLEDVIGQNAPDAGVAVQQMRAAYASRKRMAEGMKEGWFQRLRDAQQVGTNDAAGNVLSNAHDTPEGQQGVFLGQANRMLHDLGASPTTALNSTGDIATGDTSRELAQNIGQVPTDQIRDSADAQAKGIKILSSAGNKAQSGTNPGTGATLAQGIAALSLHTFPTAKLHWLRQLEQATFIPDAKAKVIGDMLFSTDSRLTQKALDYIAARGSPGRQFVGRLLNAIPPTAAKLASDATNPSAGSAPPASVDLPPLPNIVSAPEGNAAPSGPPAPADATTAAPTAPQASPYTPALQQIYQNENPDLIDLVQRVKKQESAGDQSKVSKKGAVGVMQVEPSTGPEAAKLAGVPWDPKALRDDPSYNELLGIAYLSDLLRKYKGDVSRALAAYNAGSSKVDDALSAAGANWLSTMPAETQDYVAKVS